MIPGPRRAVVSMICGVSALAVAIACHDALRPSSLADPVVTGNAAFRNRSSHRKINRTTPPISQAIREKRWAMRRAKYISPQLEARFVAAQANLTDAKRARIARAMAQAKATGRVHNETLRAVDGEIRELWRRGELTREKGCAIVVASQDDVNRRIAAEFNVGIAPEIIARLETMYSNIGCALPLNRANMLAPARLAAVSRPAVASRMSPMPFATNDTVSGEYVDYLPILDSAVAGTNGSYSQVQTAVGNVMALATAIVDEDDFLVVADAGDFALESASQWAPANYDYAGEVANECTAQNPALWSSSICQDLCAAQYIEEDQCTFWETKFWPSWYEAWSDVAWDLIKSDVGGFAATGTTIPVSHPLGPAIIAGCRAIGYGASVGRWWQIMQT